MRWTYSKRMREAENAWAEYCEASGYTSGDMPFLFHVGFSLGVGAAQREADAAGGE